MTRWYVAAAVLAAVLTGCTSSSSSARPEPSFPNNPGHAQLVRTAALDPCPPSSTATSAGALPDVTLPCLGRGSAVHVARVRGKPMVVNVWGSWCGPCQRETPYLSRAYAQLKGSVWFLGVDDEDDPDSALDFAAHVQPAMHYPSVVDEDKKVLTGLRGPVAVPMTVFVRADGSIAFTHPGEYTGAQPLLADVAQYLGVRR